MQLYVIKKFYLIQLKLLFRARYILNYFTFFLKTIPESLGASIRKRNGLVNALRLVSLNHSTILV